MGRVRIRPTYPQREGAPVWDPLDDVTTRQRESAYNTLRCSRNFPKARARPSATCRPIAAAQLGSEQTPPQLGNCGGQNAPAPRSAQSASALQGLRNPPGCV